MKALRGPPAVTGVQAGSRSEALSFIAAVLSQEREARTPLWDTAVIVSGPAGWDRLAMREAGLILIPQFEEPAVGLAIENGHHVLMPLSQTDDGRTATIVLPRLDRIEAASAFELSGLAYERADRLAALARRSFISLVRHLSIRPGVKTPNWAQAPSGRTFARLALVGSWGPSTQERELVARATGTPWQVLEAELLSWEQSEDPPFRRSGGLWRAASREDLWLLLQAKLTTEDLERWSMVALDVLGATGNQASEHGAPRDQLRSSSSMRVFRAGVADGAALIGALGTQDRADGPPAASWASRLVDDVLGNADASSDTVWQELSDVLPALAEASPDMFLSAVDGDLRRDQSSLRARYSRPEDRSAALLGSRNVGLLWALETLAWSADYLSAATLALADLTTVDATEERRNQPLRSLRAIFLPWYPQTAASLDERLVVIDRIRQRFPDVGWALIESLLPRLHDTSTPVHTPRYRDWKPERTPVPTSELLRNVKALVERSLEDVAEVPERWIDLLGRIGDLSPLDAAQVLDELGSLDPARLSPTLRTRIWERLVEDVARHRRFSDANWAMTPDALSVMERIAARFRPGDPVERAARTFEHRVQLEETPRGDYAGYRDAVDAARKQAVNEVFSEEGEPGIKRLAEIARLPEAVGVAIVHAGVDIESRMLAWLDATGPVARTAAAWVAAMRERHGVGWVDRVTEDLSTWPSSKQVAFLLALPTEQNTWRLLDEVDQQTVDDYWKGVRPWTADQSSAGHLVDQLLEYSRPWEAIDLVAASLTATESTTSEAWRATPALIERALRSALKAAPSDVDDLTSAAGYEVGLLLDQLVGHGIPKSTIAELEWSFFPVLEHVREPAALFATLESDPHEFVSLVSMIYRADGPAESDEPDRMRPSLPAEPGPCCMPGADCPGRTRRVALTLDDSSNGFRPRELSSASPKGDGSVTNRSVSCFPQAHQGPTDSGPQRRSGIS